MENEIYTAVEEEVKHQLAMLALGTLAGFVAGKAANALYKTAVEAYRNRKQLEVK